MDPEQYRRRAQHYRWGETAPIYENEPFHPEHVAMMGKVFDDVLDMLDLVDREDPITRLVAKKVIELAQAGERDPDRLKRLTLEAFGEDRTRIWRGAGS